MGILNLGGGSGLLGLGGIGGVSSTGALGTMGGLLDPQEMKKQQIKNAMLQAGISLMTNGGIGEAAGAGLLGAQQARDQFVDTAKTAYDFQRTQKQDSRQDAEWEMRMKEQERQDKIRKAQEAWMAAPDDQSLLAQAYPDAVAKQKIDLMTPKAPTYETVQTDEGVFRVPNNNADPKAMVKIGERPNRNEGEGREFAQEAKLRDVYIKQAKPFEDLRINYQRIQAANQDNSGASDIAMVYSFMKMLDPTSVVREGEFATAQNAGGIPDQIKSMYNKAISGERLTQEVRSSFMQQAGRQFEQQFQSYQQVQNTFKSLAEQYGVDPNRVAPDLTYGVNPPPQNPLPAMSNGTPPKVRVWNPTTGKLE